MTAPSYTVRVASVRSQNPYGRGGAIFTGIQVDAEGARLDAKSHLVIKAPSFLLLTSVECGQLWRVEGHAEDNTIVVNGYRLTESTLTPVSMELLRPSGEHIITVLSENAAFQGIGRVKARKLWDRFGDELYNLLDTADVLRLSDVLHPDMAQGLADAWAHWGDTFTLQWLQSKGFPMALGRKVLNYFGADAARKIEEDPYRLVSFAANWKTTDAMARNVFGIAEDDPRRLGGAVEEALYHAFDAGHTCLPEALLERRLKRLLGQGEQAIKAALRHASGYIIRREGLIHACGPYAMERAVAKAAMDRLIESEPLLDIAVFKGVLERYQRQTGIILEPSQVGALKLANTYPFAVITGGAGTGKTTVLRAFFEICQAAGHEIFPMALSGRAARRIGEATGQKATTIAGFLTRFDPDEAPEHAVLVIDEASMVDLPSAYRLVQHLPSGYRVLLVGDMHQLLPVGPGLLLHELVRQPDIPVVELTQVKRYGGAIAEAAAAIRHGRSPDLPNDPAGDIAFVPCASDGINGLVLDLLALDLANTQVLCATRNAAAGGVKAVNALCQQRLNPDGEELMLWNFEYNAAQGTGFRVGDPVICLANDWEKNLQNGSLGKLETVEPLRQEGSPDRCLGQIRWDDGELRDLTPDLLPNLELAYAITIHKAQGSEFQRVIIPVRRSNMLDRTLLYTAITRAKVQVILVGDLAAAQAAVIAPPHADRRQVALGALLNELAEVS